MLCAGRGRVQAAARLSNSFCRGLVIFPGPDVSLAAINIAKEVAAVVVPKEGQARTDFEAALTKSLGGFARAIVEQAHKPLGETAK